MWNETGTVSGVRHNGRSYEILMESDQHHLEIENFSNQYWMLRKIQEYPSLMTLKPQISLADQPVSDKNDK